MKIFVFPAIWLTALFLSVPVWAAKPAAKTKAKPAASAPAAEPEPPPAPPEPPPVAAPTPPPPPKEAAKPAPEAKVAGEEVRSKDVATAEEFDDKYSLVEKAGKTYYFVGARFRYAVIPKFMMTLFGDGGTSVGIPAFGPEFTIRKNGFEYVMSLQYTSYAMDSTPFKSKTDPPASWELVKSTMKAMYFMSDFLWSSEINPAVAINYGAGLGIGIIWGDLYRVQAQPGAGGAGDPYSYVQCQAPSNNGYCGTDNAHYPGYSEPSWSNGGSKPIMFPWLALQTGVRWKPHRHFAGRLDLGWNILNGPFIGIAGNYGI